jgi:hypothetical protein
MCYHIYLFIYLALGIGYYLLNGVHPYTRSANPVHISNANSDLTHPTDISYGNEEPSVASPTTSLHEETQSINT